VAGDIGGLVMPGGDGRRTSLKDVCQEERGNTNETLTNWKNT
jgi:hypothetical protein